MALERFISSRGDCICLAITQHYPQLESLKLISSTNNSSNLLFQLVDEFGTVKYFVKDFVLQEEPKTSLDNEIEANALLSSNLEVPLPESLALCDPQANIFCLIRQNVPGIPLSSVLSDPTGSLKNIVTESASILAQMHKITSNTWTHHLNNHEGSYTTWKEYFAVRMRKEIKRATERGILQKRQLGFFQSKLDQIPDDRNPLPTFVHGDYSPDNIVISKDTQHVATIVDFELARIWIPIWDLTRIKQVGGYGNYFDHFIQSYAEMTSDDPNDLLEEVDFYAPFENLIFWNWGWNKPSLRKEIIKGIQQTITL